MISHFRPFHFSGRTNKPQGRLTTRLKIPWMGRHWWVAQLPPSPSPLQGTVSCTCTARRSAGSRWAFGWLRGQTWPGTAFDLPDAPSWGLGLKPEIRAFQDLTCAAIAVPLARVSGSVALTSPRAPASSQGTTRLRWRLTHVLALSFGVSRTTYGTVTVLNVYGFNKKSQQGSSLTTKKKKHSAILSGARFTCCSALLVLTKGGTKVIPRVTLGTVSKAFAHGHRLYPCQIMEPPFFSPLLFLNSVILALRQILKN